MATSPTTTLPIRSLTNPNPDEAIPDEDNTEVSKLFHERLQAWKHAIAYMQDYVESTDKMYRDTSKDYERVLKTVNNPLKEGHHFDQNMGGIAGLFENVRTNTQGLVQSNQQTAKTIKDLVLPTFERLLNEIKSKTKELTKGAGKGSKAVDKARQVSQKHIELLGQHTASFDSGGSGIIKASDDPYILQRQVYHRLNKQVQEENNNRDDMIAVQNNFAQFEAHVIQSFQHALSQFHQAATNQAEQTRTMYADVLGNAQRIPLDFEWNGFVQRNANVLIDPSSSKRSVENISFANQDHKGTRPLIAGTLERKTGLLKKTEASFYVVTASKYLHEFKTDDDFAKDPSPENSLYLPDCLIGAVDGIKFNVRGKDSSGSSLTNKIARAHEFQFKAHTSADAQKWHSVIASVAGQTTSELPESSAPTSPTAGKDEVAAQPEGISTQSTVPVETVTTTASPT